MYNQVINVSHNALTVRYLLLCQRAPIATCSKRIPNYAYYTCQSGSNVSETDRRRHCPCLRWVPYIPETMTQSAGAEPGLTAR